MEKYLVEVHNSLIGKNSLRKDENDLLRANLRVPAVRKHLKNTHFTFLEQSNQMEKSGEKRMVPFLKYNYTVKYISHAVYSISGIWHGKESNMLASKIDSYEETLKLTSNQNVIAVIKLVISYFEERKEKALQDEHEEDVYGRF